MINLPFISNVKALGGYQIDNVADMKTKSFDIVRLSNSTLYAVYINDTNDDVYSCFSLDDGVSWSSSTLLLTGTYYYFDVIVLSNDTLVLAGSDTGAGHQYVYWYDIGNSPSIWKDLSTTTPARPELSTDASDNVHVLYYNTAGATETWRYYIYRNDLGAWSSSILVYESPGNTIYPYVASIYVTDDYDIKCLVNTWDGSHHDYYYCYKTLSASSFGYTHLYESGSTEVPYNTKIITDSSGVTYCFLGYFNDVTSKQFIDCYAEPTEDHFEIINESSYSNYLDDVQINADDEINIIYHGTGFYHAQNLLKTKTYDADTDTLSDEGFITTGSNTITEGYYVYQLAPNNMNVYSGYACIYQNITDGGNPYFIENEIFYLDEYSGDEASDCQDVEDLNLFCIYDSTDCITINDTAIMYISQGFPGLRIGWSLHNSTGTKVLYDDEIFIFTVAGVELHIPYGYSTGVWTFYVTTYDEYIDNGHNANITGTTCKESWSFCVESTGGGTEEMEGYDYGIRTMKLIYKTGEFLDAKYILPSGEKCYFTITSSFTDKIIYTSQNLTGTGTYQYLNDFKMAYISDPANLTADYYFFKLYNSTDDVEIEVYYQREFAVITSESHYEFLVYPIHCIVGNPVSLTILHSLTAIDNLYIVIFNSSNVTVKTYSVNMDDFTTQTFKYYTDTLGTFNAMLYYYTPYGYEPFDNENHYFYVVTSLMPSDYPDYFANFPGWVKAIIGAIIIMTFTIIPLIVMNKAKLKNSTILEGLTAGMLFFSVGLTTYWGFIPDFILPTMIFGTILIIFLVWFSKRQATSE